MYIVKQFYHAFYSKMQCIVKFQNRICTRFYIKSSAFVNLDIDQPPNSQSHDVTAVSGFVSVGKNRNTRIYISTQSTEENGSLADITELNVKFTFE